MMRYCLLALSLLLAAVAISAEGLGEREGQSVKAFAPKGNAGKSDLAQHLANIEYSPDPSVPPSGASESDSESENEFENESEGVNKVGRCYELLPDRDACKECLPEHEKWMSFSRCSSTYHQCPDNFSTLKFHTHTVWGESRCMKIDSVQFINAALGVVNSCEGNNNKESKRFGDPGCREEGVGGIMKAKLLKIGNSPHGAGLLIKRVSPCNSDVDCHVFKRGVCISCEHLDNPCDWEDAWMRDCRGSDKCKNQKSVSGEGAKSWGCTKDRWFKSSHEKEVIAAELKNWAKICVARAFYKNGDKKGHLRKDFQCNNLDQERFQNQVKAF